MYPVQQREISGALQPALTLQADLAAGGVRRKTYLLVSIIAAALVLRLYDLTLYPLTGDEYGSLAEAKSLGLNWNSIVYSAVMHFWIQLGTSELWLRLPSAFLGTATVAVIFKIGEKLGGWRSGVVAALLAATSPFNIYHSQEVRFYSFFIFTAAAFMLATINFAWVKPEVKPNWRGRAWLLLAGIGLFFSHFIGPLALYVQGGSALYAGKSTRAKRFWLMVLLGLPLIGCALLLMPALHHQLWRVYQAFGNAPNSFEPAMTPVSIFNLAKVAFAGFIFIFGYHVYPLQIALVLAGGVLSGLLLLLGTRKLWKETPWGILPIAYLLALIGIYLVLDAAGGRLASGVSPRHVAFVWPMFVTLTALGITSFKKPALYILTAALLLLNVVSVRAGWQKEWTYGNAVDYREAAADSSRWLTKDTAIIHDGRSRDEIEFYFSKGAPLIYSWPYIEDRDLVARLSYQRLIFITDDWEPECRRDSDRLMMDLNNQYSIVDGRVDYPFFEYLMERKPAPESAGFALRRGTNQVQQPFSNYGIEFKDLHLPLSVKVNDVPLTVLGAYGLPNLEGSRELSLPLAQPVNTKRMLFLSNLIGASGLRSGETIGEVLVENKTGTTLSIPLRIGNEVLPWDQQCGDSARCKTVFQWRKRLAIVGQNRYQGAHRDFIAGLHGVVFDLPESQEVAKLTIRYSADLGQLYIWGVALPPAKSNADR